MKPSMMPQKTALVLSGNTALQKTPPLASPKTVITEPLGAFNLKDPNKEVVWGKKRTVNGYKRTFTPHALHRMRERGITRTDIKNATHNIRVMSPLSNGRWMLVSKDGLVVIGLLEENNDQKFFVILTAYWPS